MIEEGLFLYSIKRLSAAVWVSFVAKMSKYMEDNAAAMPGLTKCRDCEWKSLTIKDLEKGDGFCCYCRNKHAKQEERDMVCCLFVCLFFMSINLHLLNLCAAERLEEQEARVADLRAHVAHQLLAVGNRRVSHHQRIATSTDQINKSVVTMQQFQQVGSIRPLLAIGYSSPPWRSNPTYV